MTFSQSIPIAKQMAENALQKGFDFEAFVVLCEISKMDAIPESSIDNAISDIGQIFVEYYFNPTSDSLAQLMDSFANVLTEIYNTIDNDKDKAMVRDKIRNLIGLFD